jgi:superfamily II DNA or RNA helicase
MELLCKGYAVPKQTISKAEENLILKDLKVAPFIPGDYGKRPKPFKVYQEDEHYYYVPRFWGIKNFGEPGVIDYDLQQHPFDVTFKGALRPYQQEIIAKLDAVFYDNEGNLKPYAGGIVSIPPGGGKTVIAIYYACKLKMKTLIIVHKTFLLDQWVERLQEYTDASIGIIRQNKVNVENKEVVIAMLQTLLSRDYDDLLKQFNTVVIDECHHTSAEGFSQVLPKIHSPYMIGLSATPERLDKLEKVFYWHMGDLLHRGEQKKNASEASVKMYYFKSDHPKFVTELIKWNMKPNMAKMITNLTEIEERNVLIVNIIKDIMRNDPERKVFLLTNRRNHIDELHQRLKEVFEDGVGLYIGGMKKEKLKESEEKAIILGTYEMASEGLDIQDLDTLVLATPKSNIVQSIGRIMRKQHGDYVNTPLIVDIVDRLDVFYAMSHKRKKIYTTNKYQISYINLSQQPEPPQDARESNDDDDDNLDFID